MNAGRSLGPRSGAGWSAIRPRIASIATATEFWDVAGYAPQKTAESTMSADDLVDAALAGLYKGETVTSPALHEGDAWTRWEQDRRQLASQIRNPKPAPRYSIALSRRGSTPDRRTTNARGSACRKPE